MFDYLEWITDSIKANRRLSESDYLVYKHVSEAYFGRRSTSAEIFKTLMTSGVFDWGIPRKTSLFREY